MSPGFKKANLVSMRKAITENYKNVSTDIIAATFENEIGSEEVSGEREFGVIMGVLMLESETI